MTTITERLDSIDRRIVIAAAASDAVGYHVLALEIRCIADEIATLARLVRADVESRRPLTQRELATNVSQFRAFIRNKR